MDSKRSNRRGFLKNGAALASLAVGAARSARGQASDLRSKGTSKELIAYGERSRFVTSIRVPVAERPSPDAFGLAFHVLTPLQDSVGIITPSSLFYVGTHRGSYVPEVDPDKHRFMIHGMVDRPLTFTMEELKRLPYVTRVHFLECIGNRARPTHKTVQETHGMTSCAEFLFLCCSRSAACRAGRPGSFPKARRRSRAPQASRLGKPWTTAWCATA
jgi:sulfane dehydrogenase subunit SoxC